MGQRKGERGVGNSWGIFCMLIRLGYRLCESGFIPGSLYTVSRWYKKDEISKRFAIYFFGNNLATALSGLLSAGM